MTAPAQKPGKSRQDYETPRDLLAAVVKRFGPLAVDLAARADNAKAPAFLGPEQDSLSVPWAVYLTQHARGAVVQAWLNPPFADIEPWAKKAAEETRGREMGLRVLMLTPASVGSEWFRLHVHGRAFVLGLSPRLTFVGAKDPYPKDCMLSCFGYEPGFDVWRWK